MNEKPETAGERRDDAPKRTSSFGTRLASALVLVPIAIVVVWQGNWLLAGFVMLAAAIMSFEWNRITKKKVGRKQTHEEIQSDQQLPQKRGFQQQQANVLQAVDNDELELPNHRPYKVCEPPKKIFIVSKIIGRDMAGHTCPLKEQPIEDDYVPFDDVVFASSDEAAT